MLRRRSDYRFVDVGRIPVNGNFLPARDVMSKGGGVIPHAEDAAYLLEMYCERFGNGDSVYTDEVYMMPSEDALWIAMHNLPYSVSWQRVFVDPDYEFSPIYDASSDSSNLYSQYPDAFSMTPATKDEAFEAYDLARRCPMSIDTLRRAFYDYQRIVRFNERYSDAATASEEITNEAWYMRDGAWTKVVTKTQDSSFHRYLWRATGVNYNNADHWHACTYTSSATSTVSLNFVGNYLRHDYIDSVIAFVRIKTYFKDSTEGNEPSSVPVSGETPVGIHIIPFDCAKNGSGWELPSNAISIATAKSALSRDSIDETPPNTEHPPDEYPSGSKNIYKYAVADMSVIGAVCRFDFPSDFSELEWGWEPSP